MMRFTASQLFPCRSGIGEPHNVTPGTECAYVPPGPRMVCADCLPLVVIEGDAPDPGTKLCTCTGQRHWKAPDDEGGPWVHDKCGLPGYVREKDNGSVMTPLGLVAAQAADAGGSVTPDGEPCPDRVPEEGERLALALADVQAAIPDELSAIEQAHADHIAQHYPETVGAPVHDGAMPTNDQPGGAVVPPQMPANDGAPDSPPASDVTAIVCPTPDAKRGRGRPRKVLALGLVAEKLPGADKWCVVHEATSTPILVGIASKAKTVEPLTRLGQTRIDWTAELSTLSPGEQAVISNEQMRLVNPAHYREEIYREYARLADPRDTDGGSADIASGAGVAAGTTHDGIPAAEGTSGPGGESGRGSEGLDQSGIATPVPGGGGDRSHLTGVPVDEAGMPTRPTDAVEGSEESAPGFLDGVVGPNGFLVPDSILNGTFVNGASPFVGHVVDGATPDLAGYGVQPRTETRDGHSVVWPSGGVGHVPGGTVDQPFAPLAGPTFGHGQVAGPAAQGPSATTGQPGAVPGAVIDSSAVSLAAFFAGTKSVALAGNTQWAVQTATELREAVKDFADNTDRNLQIHLGPSEIGTPCDRQVVGKLVGIPVTNHVTDPWPSFMGTAGHAAMEKVFERVNNRLHRIRYHTERKVEPHPDHAGTSDLYDEDQFAVLDHKFLGESGMAHLRSPQGPPIKYKFQLLLYALGYRRLGYRVDRIAIIGWPRTGSSLDGMYVWDHMLVPEDDAGLQQLFDRMAWRQDMAQRIRTGQLYMSDVPAIPDEDDCYFCLAGETQVITRQGVRPIADLAGGTHELLIPSGKANAARGTFVPVPVRNLGTQPLYAVNLRRYRATRTVYATAEHRWIMADGAVRTTAELSGGESLASVRAEPARSAAQIPVAVAQGFTYGDGTRGQGRRPASLTIYGRSTGDEHMLPYFGMTKTTSGTTPGGDTTTRINSLPRFWKDLPPLDESRSFLLSWLSGYFAADGGLTDKGQATISSADRESLVFVRDVAALCGVGYGTIRTRNRVGTGTEATPLHSIDLAIRDLPPWFWVLPQHVDVAARRVAADARETRWSVESVSATDRVEDVYCATVPDVEAFALVDGITTGNCPYYRPQSAKDGGPGCPGHAAN